LQKKENEKPFLLEGQIP